MPASVETELKLTAADDAALEVLAAAETIGPARLGPATTLEETDVYLDTDDGRLAAARWACRLRTRGARRWISLKGPAMHQPGVALHLRPEEEGPVGEPQSPSSWPPSPARDRVLELAGDAALGELLTLRQLRTEREAFSGPTVAATLSLDRVEVVVARRVIGRLRVVELELAPGWPDDDWLEQVRLALLAVEGLHPEPASKLELALDMAGRAGAGG